MRDHSSERIFWLVFTIIGKRLLCQNFYKVLTILEVRVLQNLPIVMCLVTIRRSEPVGAANERSLYEVHTFTQVVLVFRSRWLEEINLVQVFPWPKYTLVCMYLKNNCKKCVMLFWGNDTVDKAIIRVKFHGKSFYSYRQLKINCHEIILCLPTILLHILYPMYFIALWEE